MLLKLELYFESIFIVSLMISFTYLSWLKESQTAALPALCVCAPWTQQSSAGRVRAGCLWQHGASSPAAVLWYSCSPAPGDTGNPPPTCRPLQQSSARHSAAFSRSAQTMCCNPVALGTGNAASWCLKANICPVTFPSG